jgi:hypothetical protein
MSPQGFRPVALRPILSDELPLIQAQRSLSRLPALRREMPRRALLRGLQFAYPSIVVKRNMDLGDRFAWRMSLHRDEHACQGTTQRVKQGLVASVDDFAMLELFFERPGGPW